MIRVLLADDDALARGALHAIVTGHEDIEIVAEVADGEQAVGAAMRLHPDVAVLDIRMPKLDGLAAAGQILSSPTHCRVIMLTTFDLDEYVYEALKLGASGFLLKDAPPEQLLAAIRHVVRDDALLAPQVTRRLIERYTRPQPEPSDRHAGLATLTNREREVLRHIARGQSNAEIASELFLSEATVKTHVSRILAKLALRDRAQAVALAYEAGLVTIGSSPTGEGA
jgi:DNA-binding NarL/FixJ family response regulator